MNVLRGLFDTFSQYHYTQFASHADRTLPVSLLRFVEVPDPLRPRLQRIRALLSAEPARGAEPELYFPLHRLAAGEDPGEVEVDIGLLELHLGLAQPAMISQLPNGFYRLIAATGEVYEVRQGQVRTVEPRPFRSLTAMRARAMLPYPSLYADLFPETLYPSRDCRTEWIEGLERLEGAALLVSRYDPELFRDLDGFLSCIGVLPSTSSVPSANQRLRYFRTVFLNPLGFRLDVDMLGEYLIHEFYHQRMYQWWFYEPVEGLPEEEVRMISPVSHTERAVRVMLHGLVIYLEGMRYYLWCVSRPDLPAESRSWERLAKLTCGIPALVAELGRFAPPGSEFAAQVAYLGEVYAELAPAAEACLSL